MYNNGNSSRNVTGSSIVDGTVETVDIADDAVTAVKLDNAVNTDIATGISGKAVADLALPKAGGTMTGDIIGLSGSGSNLTGVVRLTNSITAPSSPAIGDQWFDDNTGVKTMNVWNGTQWDLVSNETFTVATGGTVTTDGNYKVHTFNSSSAFVVSQAGVLNSNIEYLVVAGGGGGGGVQGGTVTSWSSGGGGGGYKESTVSISGGTSYTVIVGAGGTGTQGNGAVIGTAGGSSEIIGSGLTTVTATGGGAGGTSSYAPGGTSGVTSANAGGSGTTAQGWGQGGGGGQGAAGSNGTTTVGGDGGIGRQSDIKITSTNVYYGGGGGGGIYQFPGGAGGLGGGGSAANAVNSNGDAGDANTGGGGSGATAIGGDGSATYTGGAGGSGIVVIRYQFQAA
jgi:hypothetical protein